MWSQGISSQLCPALWDPCSETARCDSFQRIILCRREFSFSAARAEWNIEDSQNWDIIFVVFICLYRQQTSPWEAAFCLPEEVCTCSGLLERLEGRREKRSVWTWGEAQKRRGLLCPRSITSAGIKPITFLSVTLGETLVDRVWSFLRIFLLHQKRWILAAWFILSPFFIFLSQKENWCVFCSMLSDTTKDYV